MRSLKVSSFPEDAKAVHHNEDHQDGTENKEPFINRGHDAETAGVPEPNRRGRVSASRCSSPKRNRVNYIVPLACGH